jgi:hypothetical protein
MIGLAAQGVLKSRLALLLLIALVMAVGLVIHRVRLLWHQHVPYQEIPRDRLLRWGAGVAGALAVLIVAAEASLPTEHPVVVRQPTSNANVIRCMRIHNMKDADEVLPSKKLPRSEDLNNQIPAEELYRTVFRWCDDPRPTWAQADGYTKITVTAMEGPDPSSLDFGAAYRVQAPCKKLNAKFTLHLSWMDVGRWETSVPIHGTVYWLYAAKRGERHRSLAVR